MADTKISALTAVATPATTDEFAVNQGGTSKKETLQQVHDGIAQLSASAALADANKIAVTQSSVAKAAALTDLVTYLQTGRGLPFVKSLSSNAGSNSTTTMAKITGLDLTLGAGTYYFQYAIRYQAGATTTGVKFAVNHSGTVTTFLANHAFSQALSTAASLAADQTIAAGAVGLASYMGTRGANTVAGPTTSTGAANSDMLWLVEGLLVVTVSGDLQLFHASEVAAASTVMAGSTLLVWQAL